LKFAQTLDVCRVLYNSCVADRKNAFEKTGKGLTRVRQQEIHPKLVSDKAIGVDVGIHNFADLSTGETIANSKYLQATGKKLKKKQRKLFSKTKGSNNRRKARIALARLHRKVRNQRSDFHHKTSHNLVDTYRFIAAEDLNITGMVRNHHLAKSISDAGWGQFLNYLAYKRKKLGASSRKSLLITQASFAAAAGNGCLKRLPKGCMIALSARPSWTAIATLQ
jgi:IS605 OrfB family transposase